MSIDWVSPSFSSKGSLIASITKTNEQDRQEETVKGRSSFEQIRGRFTRRETTKNNPWLPESSLPSFSSYSLCGSSFTFMPGMTCQEITASWYVNLLLLCSGSIRWVQRWWRNNNNNQHEESRMWDSTEQQRKKGQFLCPRLKSPGVTYTWFLLCNCSSMIPDIATDMANSTPNSSTFPSYLWNNCSRCWISVTF